jgi:hypothetical protein
VCSSDLPGSRSEGSLGVLTYAGRPLAGFPGRLWTPIGVFHYLEAEPPWAPQGWFRIETIPVPVTTRVFDQADRVVGVYRGPWRPGTPAEWCYLPHQESWIDPLRLISAAR